MGTGICEADGKLSQNIRTCNVCGRKVCSEHFYGFGCAICRATEMAKK